MPRSKMDSAQARSQFVGLRMTDRDLACIDMRAEQASMTRSHFIREIAREGQIVIDSSKVHDLELIDQFRRLANNLNQLMPHAHIHRHIPAQTDRILEAIEAVMMKLLAQYNDS